MAVNQPTTQGVTRHDRPPPADAVTVFGPASLSNLGPGFDTLGLCLAGPHDTVVAWETDAAGIHVEQGGGRVNAPVPTDPARNTAARAAQEVLRMAGARGGVVLRIEKGIALGSGIGGSAASAVAGAWATNVVLGQPFDKEELVEAALTGEAVASGCRHGDNALPALFGGLVLTSPVDPTVFRRIVLPRPLPVAVVLPRIEILTHRARAILPVEVPFRAAIHNAADLAFLLDAFRAGDWITAGQQIMKDRLVEPVRARLVPCYEAVRHAALEAGATGCALTGSGPAMFAIAETAAEAQRAFEAMRSVCREAGVEADGYATEAAFDGVRTAS